MDPDSLLKLLLALFFVILNGFFVAAEFSIVKVRHSQIQIKAEGGNASAKQAEKIIKNLDAYLSATQLGITLASLALGFIGESTMHHILEAAFSKLSIDIAPETLSTMALAGSFLVVTMMHIVFGELVPKSIAIRKSEATTLFVAWPLLLFYNIFKPFIWLMNAISNAFLRLINIHPVAGHEIHSTEELQLLVKQSAAGGEIEEENYEIIKNAFDFTDHTAKQVMVPRQNIITIDISEDNDVILSKIIDCGYSRIPVYENSIDNIIGIFYTKEIMREYIKNKDVDLRKFLREAFFVVGSKKISELMNVFQQKKQHIAIVIDEFGGTEGIVTLEDILEELVGEIQDEEDDEQKLVDEVAENTFWIHATQPLDEINEYLPSPLPEDSEYNSLAGYIMYQLSDIPEENQEFRLCDYAFKILKMQNKSVEMVELKYEPRDIEETNEETEKI